MGKLFLFVFLVSLSACGQSTKSLKTSLEKIYAQAIGDFIHAATQRNKTHFDTLYFGNRKNGQPDDFPAIELPETIQHTHIKLISPEVGKTSQLAHKSRIYINLIGWVEKGNAQFIFFVFSNGFEHQYNYTLDYTYNDKNKTFELAKVLLKEPPFKP